MSTEEAHMRQNATEQADSPPLRPRQRHVIELLVSGHTVTAAAAEAGIDRSTVHRWLSEDYDFLSEFNAAKLELREACVARLVSLANAAINGLDSALQNGDGRLAPAFLKELGLVSPPRIGSTDPEEVKEDIASDLASKRALRMLTRMSAEL